MSLAKSAKDGKRVLVFLGVCLVFGLLLLEFVILAVEVLGTGSGGAATSAISL